MLRLPDVRWSLIAMAALSLGLLACSSPATPADPDRSAELASLRQQVGGQATRIAALETKVALPQPTAIPPQPVAAAPTAPPKPAAPTPTMIPVVAGLTTEGATKGVATAKVTLTEYVDYL